MVAGLGLKCALRRLDRLRRDRRGSYLLEYALLFGAFVMVLVVCLEAALQLLIATALDHGARQASRSAALGPIGGVQTSSTMLTRILSGAGLPLAAWEAEPPILTAQSFASYQALAADLPLPGDRSCPGVPSWGDTVGGSAGIVRYCVHFTARSFTPLGSLLPALYQHRAFFVVQNEPY